MNISNVVDRVIKISSLLLISIYSITFSLSPLSGEDYGLSKYFANESITQRLSWAAVRSMQQITHWNARFGEQLSIFSLSMPEPYFIFISILSFILLSYICCSIFDIKSNLKKSMPLAIVLIYFLWPGFEVFFWRTANAGYLQPMILTFLAMYPFFSKSRMTYVINNKYILSLAYIAALLSGLSFENVPIATAFFMVAVLTQSKMLKTRLILSPVFVIVGWLILMLAPSTAHRAAYYRNALGIEGFSVEQFKVRFFDVLSHFLDTTWVLLLLSVCSLFYLGYTKKINSTIVFLTISAVMVVGSVTMSPYTEPRAFMFSWCCMLFVVFLPINDLMQSECKGKLILLPLTLISVSFSLYILSVNVSYFIGSKQRDIYIEQMKKTSACETGIKIEKITVNSQYRYLNSRDSWLIGNPYFSERYFGCKIIK